MEVKPGYKLTEVGVIPEDWSFSRLIQLSDRIFDYRGRTPKKLGLEWGHGIIPALSAGNVKSGYIDFNEECNFGSDLLYRRWMTNGDLSKNDIVFTMEAPLGNVALIPDKRKYILSQRTICIRAEDGSTKSKFLFHYLQSEIFRRLLLDNATGSTATGIKRKRLEQLFVVVPPLPEQTAIATTLSDVDALISSLDALISKKKQIKQGAMQELLSGKRRLPGFSGEWEVKRLGEVGQCFRGVSYNPSNDLLPHDHKNSIRLLRSNNIQNSFVNILDIQFVKSYRVSSTQIMSRNDILICMANGSKDLVGKVGLINQLDSHSYTFGAFMGCLRSNIKNDPIYIFNLMQSDIFRRHISITLAGSSINNLKPSDIEFFKFSIPPLPEQQAIATILSDMDAEITTLEARRDKAKLLKQGMMQELLTGRIRLVPTILHAVSA